MMEMRVILNGEPLWSHRVRNSLNIKIEYDAPSGVVSLYEELNAVRAYNVDAAKWLDNGYDIETKAALIAHMRLSNYEASLLEDHKIEAQRKS